MEKLELRTTLDEVNAFKESILWADFVSELEFWKEGFAHEMDSIVEDSSTSNPSTASVLMHLGDINGRKKAVDYLLGIPDMFIEILNSKKEDEDGRNQADRYRTSEFTTDLY